MATMDVQMPLWEVETPDVPEPDPEPAPEPEPADPPEGL